MTVLSDFLDELKKGSTYQQLAVGAVAGCATGYLAAKVGTSAAMALGASLIIVKVASDKGYLTINRSKVDSELQQLKDKVEGLHKSAPGTMSQIKRFASENKYVTVGFAGGVMVGLTLS